MTQCEWEKIDNFRGIGEFNRFVVWINQQVQSGLAKEVPVKEPYVGASTLNEKWFVHTNSGQLWRLVWPDPPFVGLFELVDSNENDRV